MAAVMAVCTKTKGGWPIHDYSHELKEGETYAVLAAVVEDERTRIKLALNGGAKLWVDSTLLELYKVQNGQLCRASFKECPNYKDDCHGYR